MLSLLMVSCISAAYSQKFLTRTGKVTFFSSTPVENIEAVNNEAACIADLSSGQIMFQLPIKSFKFEKSLMQEHFNENYMESDKFPKSTFKGKISDLSAINPAKDGTYKVIVGGDLTMHGVTNHVLVPGTVTVKGGNVTAATSFKIKPADYKIAIPAVVATKIANEIEITVNAQMTASN